MDRFLPEEFVYVLNYLSNAATQLDLVQKAKRYCSVQLQNDPELSSKVEQVRVELTSLSLHFESHLSYSYFETRLALFVEGEEIGYYKLITLLDGSDNDDYFVLYPE